MTLIDIFSDAYEHVGTATNKVRTGAACGTARFPRSVSTPNRRRVLLQKKAPGRYAFDRPDYADITVGGHYHAGEDIPDGIREVHEELGLPVDYAELHPIGIRQTAVTLAPDYREREFQHVHLLPLKVDLEAIPLADAEVRGLVEVDLDDAISLADGHVDAVPAHYATRTTEGMTYREGTLARTELVPNYLNLDQLYLRLFLATHRYCLGQRRHLFW